MKEQKIKKERIHMYKLTIKENNGYINTKEIKSKKYLKLVAGLLVSSTLLAGCAKDVPCNIEGEHAHFYVSDSGLGRYIDSEKSYIGNLNRTDNYKAIESNDKELLKFINRRNLYEISKNKDAIENISENNNDYLEYEYFYHYTTYIPVGKTMVPMFNTGYSWTKEKGRSSLTGKERICTYKYYGYEVIKNAGQYKLLKSEGYKSIDDIPKKYKYIKKKFYYTDYIYDKNKIEEFKNNTKIYKKVVR